MGLWRWLFPTDEDRIAEAKRLLAKGAAADARATIDGVEGAEAEAVRVEASHALARMNLEQAITWAEAGNDAEIVRHLELCEELGKGIEAEMRVGRAKIREIRERHRQEDARREAEKPPQDELGLVGKAFVRPLPDDLGEDAIEREARGALIIENYPPSLRTGLDRLGARFVDAILTLHDGRPDLALQRLDKLPDHPLKDYETAMAAIALGDPKRARNDLRRFAQAVGHHPIGMQHTGVILAELEAALGKPDVALRLLEELRATDRRLGSHVYANLLVDAGRLDEAVPVLRDLVASYPKEPQFALTLAAVQVQRGERVQAMAALEASMQACCTAPGRCGSRPPDLEVMKRLATLYAEDGRDLPRVLELADQVGVPSYDTWEDSYLSALILRQQRDPDAELVAAKLRAQTPAGDPRRELLSRYLPAA